MYRLATCFWVSDCTHSTGFVGCAVFSLTGSIMSLAMPIGLILSGFFADRIDVNHWFLLSGILIICIAIVCPMITEIRKLDAK